MSIDDKDKLKATFSRVSKNSSSVIMEYKFKKIDSDNKETSSPRQEEIKKNSALNVFKKGN